ncbi:hypothetical protein SAMN04515672_1208 [Natronorubrum texcoconense]|uniref:Uncharacterized protein n=1 Tax=Natronorubrum texcoconense TaxID=1095776 RepID=A0A1G8V7H4_9EURY|nr:hypothetical protein SAMN04515672_1208 [Natronorubrum texcoconense]
MSMSNFIRLPVVARLVMAATNPSARTSASADDPAESGAGMAHLTVVPANFEASEQDGDED